MMDAEKIASIRRRVDAVIADLPIVTDSDLVAYVAGVDAEMLLDELVAAQARVQKLEAGLAWYADERNYDEETGAAGKFRRLPNTVHDPGEVVFEHDGGDVARAALAGEA